MAEASYYWTTNGTGDGPVGKYSRSDLAQAHKVIGACKGFEGVAPGFLNELAGTVTGANTVSINSGGGLVDGIPYRSTAAVSVTIPSAVGAGNTRIDRIVLRASWSAQTVRITRIAGTDAASPTAPAITQTSETTYDILLYQALVTTGGTVTLTDERTFAATGSSGIATGAIVEGKIGSLAVTTGKIANDAVDISKIGAQVAAIIGRQGGSASNWGMSGGTSNYTPTTLRIQAGCFSTPTSRPGGGIGTITFPTSFSAIPVVFFQNYGDVGGGTAGVVLVSNSVSAISYTMTDDVWTSSRMVNWIALGPE